MESALGILIPMPVELSTKWYYRLFFNMGSAMFDAAKRHAPAVDDDLAVSLFFFTWFTSIYLLSGPISSLLFSRYNDLARLKDRVIWRNTVVSSCFAATMSWSGLCVLLNDNAIHDTLVGSSTASRLLICIACGYFMWDAADCIINVNIFGVQFIAHGVACLVCYAGALRPFAQYYLVGYLLYETSTIFVNINWFLEITKQNQAALMANRIVLLCVFIGVRWVWGGFLTYHSTVDMLSESDPERCSKLRAILYLSMNWILTTLNLKWGWGMISKALAAARGETPAGAAGKKDK